MKISELMGLLLAVHKKYGDIPVGSKYDESQRTFQGVVISTVADNEDQPDDAKALGGAGSKFADLYN